PSRAEEVRLQLDRGEADRAVGQVEEAAVAAGRVGEPDDGARVEVAVRRHVLLLEREVRAGEAVPDLLELDADQPGEAGRAHLFQLREREVHGRDPTLAAVIRRILQVVLVVAAVVLVLGFAVGPHLGWATPFSVPTQVSYRGTNFYLDDTRCLEPRELPRA